MADVTVIGAGVAGLWAAFALSKAGLGVRILDRHGPPGPHGCSWWAGGMLAPDCEGTVAEPSVVLHGRSAADAWSEVAEVTCRGSLVLALKRDKGELFRFARRTSNHKSLGCDEIRALEPDLEGQSHGLHFPREAHLDPRRALTSLVAALSSRGVEVETGEARPEDVAGTVIDARGMAAKLPGLRGVRGEMVLLHAPGVRLTRPIRLLHPRHPLYLVPRGGETYAIGATQIESEDRRGPTARSMLELLSAAHALDPRFGEAEIIDAGADLRPAFADNVPRILRKGGVLHLNGLFRHGYLMAPALARQAAAYLTQGTKGDLFHEDD